MIKEPQAEQVVPVGYLMPRRAVLAGTGMIRSSLTAVPRRLPVLWGKVAVFAGSIFPVSLVASFISFFLGQALLSSHHLGVSITAHDALRSVIGVALYLTLAGLTGVALGALLRHTAAGITTFAAVLIGAWAWRLRRSDA